MIRTARRLWRPLIAALTLTASAVTALGAQGTLSTQGLGFPPGQLSTKAATMGGAIGEADPLSPLNPAAISLLTASVIMMQAEPEFRLLTFGGASQATSVSRFPLFIGALPIRSKWVVMASASTLFDRTWGTTARDTQVVGTDTIGATVAQLSDGSIEDVRLAAAYTVNSWLRLGVGGHAYSGRDVLRTIRNFDDTLRFALDTSRSTLGFGGGAVSLGAEALWPKVAAVGLSYRRGGPLRTYQGNDVVRTSSAPDHVGVSLLYLGIEGTTLAVRLARDDWSRSAGLSPTLAVHEGLDLGLGADVRGPKFGGGSMGLRAGARWRTLPFSNGPTAVREQTYSTGLGLPLGPRAEVSVGGLRAFRSGPAGASESAWTISTGFLVRP